MTRSFQIPEIGISSKQKQTGDFNLHISKQTTNDPTQHQSFSILELVVNLLYYHHL